ncbi:3-hydroxyacyl-ACP dehydratase FabZ [Hippea maritima]|uniref:3-hydroxyacyl-[acyl-carrier-protein] dehydratase FabZ n=1 Tax=Hippea maritima (strain ATCC 700847 / DSM 10411 / MH2) TaxID=760142 RepID=F2LXD8_HIPMA|nr:3-hydroxyacyl-ACP dehydratase FabZ [Hippea maritima]AEA34252.1 (3R)-hydroxymyristoyl-(acyl-carrier-protein)dehydratase [Hippea maritima DSM 10411]
MLTIEDIKKMLPHRYPFLLVDRVLEYKEGDWIKTLKNVTYNEPFFTGHFPQVSVMPGVLMVEAMAQSGGILAFLSMNKEEFERSIGGKRMVYFVEIERARFRRPVIPGDQVIMEVKILKHKLDIWKMEGKATVDGKIVAEAKMAAKIDRELE